MANPIVQTTAAGATVATDVGGAGEGYQLIKLVDGAAGSTSPIVGTSGTPAAGTFGLVVAVKPGVSVVASVTGSVSVSGAAQVSGTVTVSNYTTNITGTVSISGTPAVTLAQTSVVAQVSGTITISNGASVSLPAVSGVVASSVAATSNAFGIPAWIVGGQTATGVPVMVTVTSTAQVTLVPGASLSTLGGTLPVTGTIQNVASISTILGAVSITGTSISVVVSGTLSVSNFASLTTVSGTVSVSNLATTTAVPSISATGAIVWMAGGQSTTAFPVYVSQINPPNAGGGATTTMPPSITEAGQIVWIAGGQSSTAYPVVITGTVAGIADVVVTTTGSIPTATATGIQVWVVGGQNTTGVPLMVSMSSAPMVTSQLATTGRAVWLAPTQTMSVVSTVATVLGTVNVAVANSVSLSSIVPVTTAASVSVSGLPVWLNPTQQVAVSGLVGHSITGSVNVVSNVTVLLQSAVSISSIVPVTTAASVSVSGLPVWLNPTQGVVVGNFASMTTVSGTVSVNNVLSVTGALVSILSTGTVNVATGTVNVATGTVVGLDAGRTQVMIMVTNTAYSGGTTMAFSICQGGSQLVAGTTSWTIPAGKVLRVLSANVIAQNSVTTTPVDHELRVLVSNALPTWTSTAAFVAGVMVNAASQTISFSACAVGVADVTAGSTIAIGYSNNTSGTLVRAFINGYLFP